MAGTDPATTSVRIVQCLREHKKVHEVIVSRGDPLTLPMSKLRWERQRVGRHRASRRHPDRHARARHAPAAAARPELAATLSQDPRHPSLRLKKVWAVGSTASAIKRFDKIVAIFAIPRHDEVGWT